MSATIHQLRQWVARHQTELLGVLLCFVVCLSVRSYQFVEHLNFSADQGLFSLKALEIVREKPLQLIGPTFSVNVDGRYAFQGPAIYYWHTLLLILGDWNPIKASWLLAFVASVMVFPLYFGTKLLANQRAAVIIVLIYSLLPYYITHTRFLWNPNYQFVLAPVLILLTGLYAHRPRWYWLFGMGVWSGLLLQFHYQFLVILVGYLLYFAIKKMSWKNVGLWLVGIAVGFSPLILFELRHQFYNTQTILLFLKSFLSHNSSSGNFAFAPHYVLSISLFGWLVLVKLVSQKLTSKMVWLKGSILALLALTFCLPIPKQGYSLPSNWNYQKEISAYRHIKDSQEGEFAVLNLTYDSVASVQKYFLTRDRAAGVSPDYTSNKHLFVIATPEQLATTQAYEITTFTPRTTVKTWDLGNNYYLYLFQKENN